MCPRELLLTWSPRRIQEYIFAPLLEIHAFYLLSLSVSSSQHAMSCFSNLLQSQGVYVKRPLHRIYCFEFLWPYHEIHSSNEAPRNRNLCPVKKDLIQFMPAIFCYPVSLYQGRSRKNNDTISPRPATALSNQKGRPI